MRAQCGHRGRSDSARVQAHAHLLEPKKDHCARRRRSGRVQDRDGIPGHGSSVAISSRARHCHEYQILEWRNVTWPKGKTAEAVYKCPHCGREITDARQAAMLQSGEWRPTAEGTPGMAGFHLWEELYSPWSTLR